MFYCTYRIIFYVQMRYTLACSNFRTITHLIYILRFRDVLVPTIPRNLEVVVKPGSRTISWDPPQHLNGDEGKC